MAAEAHRLQQQAEYEVRVSGVARRLSQEQPQQHSSVGQQLQQMSVEQDPVEDDSDTQSDWEPGERDDADVVYACLIENIKKTLLFLFLIVSNSLRI